MYTKTRANAKRILIESETTETVRLRISGPRVTKLYCSECETIEEMLELNSAADIAHVRAKEILDQLAASVLHSPESTKGHLLICRASLEEAMNVDTGLCPQPMLLKGSL